MVALQCGILVFRASVSDSPASVDSRSAFDSPPDFDSPSSPQSVHPRVTQRIEKTLKKEKRSAAGRSQHVEKRVAP
ncbi:MAG: hypothetical protein AAF449_21745, partial [Myxococcota bacterium]